MTYHLLVLLNSESQPERLPDLVERENQLVLRGLGAPLIIRELPTACYDAIKILHDRLGGALKISEAERSVMLAALCMNDRQHCSVKA